MLRRAGLSIVVTGVVAAIFEVAAGDASAKAWLYSIGGALELVGIVFVAWPELGPIARRARTKLSSEARIAFVRARAAFLYAWYRLRRRPLHRKVQSVELGTAIETDSALSVKPIYGEPGPDATDTEKISYLMGRVKMLLDQGEAHRKLIDALPEQWRREMRKSIDELRAHVTGELTRVESESLFERRWGVVLLVAGVIVSTLGNLVG